MAKNLLMLCRGDESTRVVACSREVIEVDDTETALGEIEHAEGEGYAALIVDPFNWTGEKTRTEQLKEAMEYATKKEMPVILYTRKKEVDMTRLGFQKGRHYTHFVQPNEMGAAIKITEIVRKLN